MFEYTALVDAPVQRFTGIVTGSEESDTEPAIASVMTPTATVAAMPDPTEPPASQPPAPASPIEPHAEPVVPNPPVVPIAIAPVVPIAPPAPVLRTFVPRPQPVRSPSPSVVSALVAVAAAGITAMWWLRRDSHDRFR